MNTPPILPKNEQRYRLWSLLSRLALALMEAALAAMWYRGLLQAQGAPWGEVLAVMLALVLVSQALAAVSTRVNWPLWVRQALFMFWLAGALLVSMRLLLFNQTNITLLEMLHLPVNFIANAQTDYSGFIHTAFALILIWRGVHLARTPLTPQAASLSFQMGLIFVLLYGLIFAPQYADESVTGLYLYLFGGLIALSAARITSLTEVRGGRTPQFNSVWLASTFGSAIVVVGLALLVGQMASTRLVTWVIRALAFVFSIVAALITMLLTPVVNVIWRILPGVMQALNSLFGLFTGIRLPDFLEQIVIDLNTVIQQVVPAVIAGRRLFLAALIALIVLAVLLGLRMIRMIRAPEQEEETGDIERTSLRNLLRRLRLARPDGPGARRYSPGQILAAVRIRQIYSQMMALSQRLGLTRPPAATPLEFLPDLQTLFNQETDSVQAITQAYIKVRYGEYPENSAEVAAVTAAWERVRRLGHTLSHHKPE